MKRLLLSFMAAIVAIACAYANEAYGSYEIVFNTGSGNGSTINKTDTLGRHFNSGLEYIDTISARDGCYTRSQYGLWMYSTGVAEMKIMLSDAGKVKATKIIAKAAYSRTNSWLDINMSANQRLSSTTPADYTYELDGSEISEIYFTVVGGVYISSVTVYYGQAPEIPEKITPELNWSAEQASAFLNKPFESPELSIAPEANKEELIKLIKYSSSDESVATIGEDGLVKPLAAGTTTISAFIEADDNYEAASASYSLTVFDKSYQIVFNTGSGNGSTINKTDTLGRHFNSGLEYIDTISAGDGCYTRSQYGLWMYSTGVAEMKIMLSDAGKVKATKIVAKAAYSRTNSWLDINMSANQRLSSSTPADYTYELDGSEISEIYFTVVGGVYISSVTVFYEEEADESITVNSIAETKDLNDNDAMTVAYDLTVAFVNVRNIYATDNAGDFIKIAGGNNYKVNDVIPAGWKGTYTCQNNTPEITPDGELPESIGTATFVAKTVDASMITSDMVNSVIMVNNVVFEEDTPETKDMFAGTAGDTMLTFTNQYGLPSVAAGTYDINAVVACQQKSTVLNIIAYKPVLSIRINGENVTDGILDTKGDGAVLSIDIPEGYEAWYRFTPDALTANTLSDDANDGFVKYTEPVTFNEPGRLEYYSLETATGIRSEIRSLKLDGVTGIDEILNDNEGQDAVYYNLQGVRIDKPTTGVYIRLQGTKATKVAK